MGLTFNPFDPFGVVNAWSKAVSRASSTSAPATGPIAIKGSGEGPALGIQLAVGKDSITLSGTSAGPEVKKYLDGTTKYEIARGVGFSLDVDKADTKNDTDYTEKNHRLFGIDTQKGWSAAKCAQLLADKVNAGDAPFNASVVAHADGSATIKLTRD
ncbi:MAG TPA: hypothetical protein VGO62_15030 [Myxococcota bacterium]